MLKTEAAIRELAAAVERFARHLGAGHAITDQATVHPHTGKVTKDGTDEVFEKKVRAVLSDLNAAHEKAVVAGDKVKQEAAKKAEARAKLSPTERAELDKEEADKATAATHKAEQANETKRVKEQKKAAGR